MSLGTNKCHVQFVCKCLDFLLFKVWLVEDQYKVLAQGIEIDCILWYYCCCFFRLLYGCELASVWTRPFLEPKSFPRTASQGILILFTSYFGDTPKWFCARHTHTDNATNYFENVGVFLTVCSYTFSYEFWDSLTFHFPFAEHQMSFISPSFENHVNV